MNEFKQLDKIIDDKDNMTKFLKLDARKKYVCSAFTMTGLEWDMLYIRMPDSAKKTIKWETLEEVK